MSRDDHAGVQYRSAARHGHVESYFLKANAPDGVRALWIKATIFAPDRAPSRAVAEAWAVAFDRDRGHVAVKTGEPFESARFSASDFDAEVTGGSFGRKAWRGEIVTGERSVAWDLAISNPTPPLVHFPLRAMYGPSLPTFKIVSLVPDARATGQVRVNGRAWTIDRWPMTIGHNWGRRHTASYAWAHCNVWESATSSGRGAVGASEVVDRGDAGAVFEGFAGRIAVGPGLSPASTFLFLRPRSRERWLARRSFFGIGPVEQESTFRRWRFRTTRGRARVEGEIWAETDDFVGLYYANPDGSTTHCLNTKIARAELLVKLPGRGERLYRSNAAALEIGTLDPDHGVRMYV